MMHYHIASKYTKFQKSSKLICMTKDSNILKKVSTTTQLAYFKIRINKISLIKFHIAIKPPEFRDSPFATTYFCFYAAEH